MVLWTLRVVFAGGAVLFAYLNSVSYEAQKLEFKSYCESYGASHQVEGCEIYE